MSNLKDLYARLFMLQKCRKTIKDKRFVNEDKIAEALSHIWLHLEPEYFIQTQHVTNAVMIILYGRFSAIYTTPLDLARNSCCTKIYSALY